MGYVKGMTRTRGGISLEEEQTQNGRDKAKGTDILTWVTKKCIKAKEKTPKKNRHWASNGGKFLWEKRTGKNE